MQQYALDQNEVVISAFYAKKHVDYRCFECQGIVRLRKGLYRHPHFYHLYPQVECEQNGKSQRHIEAQKWVQSHFEKRDCELEVRFLEIGRIADVVWFSKRLVFEIQISPISKEEVIARNLSYAKLGYQVVWLFDAQTFSQARQSFVKIALENHPHYYFYMDEEGRKAAFDVIWFQDEVWQLPLNLSKPKEIHTKKRRCLPKKLQNRLDHWPLCFEGDALSFDEKWKKVVVQEKKIAFQARIKKLKKALFFPYKAAFRALLEVCCK